MDATKDPGVSVVVLAFDLHGRVLCLKRRADLATRPGCWELPGGKVRHGETLAAAASRELHEEAGYLEPVGRLCYRFLAELIALNDAGDLEHWLTAVYTTPPGSISSTPRARNLETAVFEKAQCFDVAEFLAGVDQGTLPASPLAAKVLRQFLRPSRRPLPTE